MNPPKLLATTPRWLTWAFDKAKGTKVPTSLSGGVVSAYDPDEWHDYQAVAAHPRPAFFFQRSAGLFGVDLDGCLIDGVLLPWAQEIIDKFATYAEISPSGTGVKLYCKGDCDRKKAKKLGGEVGGKKSGVELHGYGYFCVTGKPFGEFREVTDCQTALAWLFEKYWPSNSKAVTSYAPSADAEFRAQAYMRSVPIAISGQGGSPATMYAAGVLACGFALSDAAAMPLLQNWNMRCDPPWTDTELERKLSEARKTNRKPIGYLLNETRADDIPEVDLSGFEADPLPQATEKLDPGPLSAKVFERLPGLIGEVVRFNLVTARHPQPELALAGALCLMSVLTGRKVQDDQGARTNIYTVSIAATGAGKDYARQINARLLQAGGAHALLGEDSWASGNGLLRTLSDQPAKLFQVDEIGRLFLSLKSSKGQGQEYAIGGELLKLYTSADTVYTGGAHVNKDDDIKIVEPHAVVHGTNNELFWNGVTTDNIREGLVGRLMIFPAAGRVRQRLDFKKPALPERLVAWVKAWAAWAPGGGELDSIAKTVAYTQAAEDRSRSYRRQIDDRLAEEDRTDKNRSALWVRSAEKTGKLALLFACSRIADPACEEFEVTLEDVELAIAISNWCTRKTVLSIMNEVGDSANEINRKLLLSVINRGIEDPVTMTEIYRSRAGKVEIGERNRILADLCEAGILGVRSTSTKGRAVTGYYLL